ncbi:hypothetical protein GCM10010919_33740 [Alishewanella longhuensis]|uniref:Uncharacterized protein n=1 Tax=Alishewanella longhuensis TaxID=1091037 RepID=A0ABQ3L2P3_9ALTE|nr:hypothetical protein [Alishewanella longhuensis]GHG77813.1 hypothetical protein GCM10010919_33740 [Alishewanella longhuensis]
MQRWLVVLVPSFGIIRRAQAAIRTEQISHLSLEYLKDEGLVNGARLGYRLLEFHFTTLSLLGDTNRVEQIFTLKN